MKKTKTKKDFQATCMVHWPSGPVACCDKHAKALIYLGNMLGSHTIATKLDKPTECVNCVNEEKANLKS